MLHHYTSVDTPALILQHRTIRFTRLDQFDDVTEGRSIGAYPAGARLFASCWSAAEHESIPQWNMYGDAMKGVRLSLRPDPFLWQVIDFNWHENFKVAALNAPFSFEEMFTTGVTLVPAVDMRKSFGRPVNYVPDVPSAIEKFVKQGSASEITLLGGGTEIAFFKSDAWNA